MRVLIAFGTRPEFIKLAPVVFELRRFPRRFETILLATAQHRDTSIRCWMFSDSTPISTSIS